MPRFLADVPCVNCGKDTPAIFDVPRVVAPTEEKPPVVKAMVPRHIPRYSCASGNCNQPGGLHSNDNYTERPSKKCSQCDQFQPSFARVCPWCGNDDFDDLTDDDLDGLNIPKPTGMHTHE
jgi:hypothetical protein